MRSFLTTYPTALRFTCWAFFCLFQSLLGATHMSFWPFFGLYTFSHRHTKYKEKVDRKGVSGEKDIVLLLQIKQEERALKWHWEQATGFPFSSVLIPQTQTADGNQSRPSSPSQSCSPCASSPFTSRKPSSSCWKWTRECPVTQWPWSRCATRSQGHSHRSMLGSTLCFTSSRKIKEQPIVVKQEIPIPNKMVDSYCL